MGTENRMSFRFSWLALPFPHTVSTKNGGVRCIEHIRLFSVSHITRVLLLSTHMHLIDLNVASRPGPSRLPRCNIEQAIRQYIMQDTGHRQCVWPPQPRSIARSFLVSFVCVGLCEKATFPENHKIKKHGTKNRTINEWYQKRTKHEQKIRFSIFHFFVPINVFFVKSKILYQ